MGLGRGRNTKKLRWWEEQENAFKKNTTFVLVENTHIKQSRWLSKYQASLKKVVSSAAIVVQAHWAANYIPKMLQIMIGSYCLPRSRSKHRAVARGALFLRQLLSWEMVSEGRNSRFTRTVNPTSHIQGVLLLKSSEIQAIAELYILLIDFFPQWELGWF